MPFPLDTARPFGNLPEVTFATSSVIKSWERTWTSLRGLVFRRSKWIRKFKVYIFTLTQQGHLPSSWFSICFLMEVKPTVMSGIISKVLTAISPSPYTPRKSFLLCTERETTFRLNLVISELTFPSFLSSLRKSQGFQKGLERKHPWNPKGSLRVWPWPRSCATGREWKQTGNPLWPGSPWLSPSTWPCHGGKSGIPTKGDVTVSHIIDLFCVETPYACPLCTHPHNWWEGDCFVFCPCHWSWQPKVAHRAYPPTWRLISVS